MPFWSALGGIAKSLIPGMGAAAGQERANRANAAEARKNRRFQREEAGTQRSFQERMRNSEWQAGVADMEAAGINPALAYSQGGASSPMGAAGSGAQAQMEDVISPGISSAMQVKRMKQELVNMKATERETDARTGHISLQNALAAQQQKIMYEQTRGVMLGNQMTEMGMPGLRNIMNFEAGNMGQSTRTIRSLLQSVFGSGGAFRAR